MQYIFALKYIRSGIDWQYEWVLLLAMDINFSDITEAVLVAYSMSEAQLATELGVSQPTIHRLKHGETKAPNYLLGQRLVALYEQRPKAA